jgi:hypothetical protein
MPTEPYSPHRGGLVYPDDPPTKPKHPHISRIRDVPPVTDWGGEDFGAPRPLFLPKRGVSTRGVLRVIGITGACVVALLLLVHWGTR